MRTIVRLFGAMCLLCTLAVPAQAQYRQQQRMPIPQQRMQPNYGVPQQRMVIPQQRIQPNYGGQMRGGVQRQYVQPHIQQQRVMLNQVHIARALATVRNRRTGEWGKRIGHTAVWAAAGAGVWYSLPEYDGPAYVNLPGIGMVEMDDRYESSIFPDLESGDAERIAGAIGLIQGSAIMQGLMPEGDEQEGEEEGGEGMEPHE